jgi:hypothetical protein
MLPGDTLQQRLSNVAVQHHCNVVHTVGYTRNFISSGLSAGLLKTKKLCNITSHALHP